MPPGRVRHGSAGGPSIEKEREVGKGLLRLHRPYKVFSAQLVRRKSVSFHTHTPVPCVGWVTVNVGRSVMASSRGPSGALPNLRPVSRENWGKSCRRSPAASGQPRGPRARSGPWQPGIGRLRLPPRHLLGIRAGRHDRTVSVRGSQQQSCRILHVIIPQWSDKPKRRVTLGAGDKTLRGRSGWHNSALLVFPLHWVEGS